MYEYSEYCIGTLLLFFQQDQASNMGSVLIIPFSVFSPTVVTSEQNQVIRREITSVMPGLNLPHVFGRSRDIAKSL
jgi:hypothetical protein